MTIQVSDAALGNAGYWQQESGEWRIANCTVMLRHAGHSSWSIEIRSKHGTITVVAMVKDVLIERGVDPEADAE
jgi:hypothetical protein